MRIWAVFDKQKHFSGLSGHNNFFLPNEINVLNYLQTWLLVCLFIYLLSVETEALY